MSRVTVFSIFFSILARCMSTDLILLSILDQTVGLIRVGWGKGILGRGRRLLVRVVALFASILTSYIWLMTMASSSFALRPTSDFCSKPSLYFRRRSPSCESSEVVVGTGERAIATAGIQDVDGVLLWRDYEHQVGGCVHNPHRQWWSGKVGHVTSEHHSHRYHSPPQLHSESLVIPLT